MQRSIFDQSQAVTFLCRVLFRCAVISPCAVPTEIGGGRLGGRSVAGTLPRDAEVPQAVKYENKHSL